MATRKNRDNQRTKARHRRNTDQPRAARRRKKITRFTNQMRAKLLVLFGGVCLVLAALIVRIVYIQKVDGDRYSKIVLAQQQYNSTTIPFQRGNITDCNGTVLATSVDVYNVALDCKVINEKKEYLRATVRALVKCFPELDAATLKEEIQKRGNSQYYVVAKKLPYEQIEPFLAIQDDKKKNPNVQGVWFEKEYQRKYPFGKLACSTIGFTAAGDVGVNGLEKYYDSILNGTNGREYGYLNTENDFEKTVINAQNGDTIVSTIDVNIQKVVEQEIQNFNDQYAYNARDGAGSENTAVVVTNPGTGEILAMAASPSFDLNNPRDLSVNYDEAQIAAMSDDEKMEALNRIWENYCLTQTYEPGSTAKPFTVAAALETGAVSVDESFFCDGFEHIGKRDIHCSKRSGHGPQTLKEAVMNSCNDVMMQLANRSGTDGFVKYQEIFNLGMKTNIDLPGEARTDSLIYHADNMDPTALATNAFGQNFNVTMIQMVSAYNSILNGGTYYQPHVVKKILDDKGNTVKTIEPTIVRETISKETSDLLKDYMYATVSKGTAKYAKVEGYSMGGKTGTAEMLPRHNGQYLVSYIGFAPVEEPQVLIYVVVKRPNVADQADSKYAQTIAKNILSQILPYMNIYPDEDENGNIIDGANELQKADQTKQLKKGKKKSTDDVQSEATDDTPDAQPDSPANEEQDPAPDTTPVNEKAVKQEETE